jgi:hypothetical protein
MISPRLAAELLGRIEWGEEGRDELSTLVNGEPNIFLVTRRDNRMLVVVSWHLFDAVFGQGTVVQGSPSLPEVMVGCPSWTLFSTSSGV